MFKETNIYTKAYLWQGRSQEFERGGGGSRQMLTTESEFAC